MSRTTICPNCGTPIDVEQSLSQSIREEYLVKYQESIKEFRVKAEQEKELQQQALLAEKQKAERESQELKTLVLQLQNQQQEQTQKIELEKQKYLAERRQEIENIAREQALSQAKEQQAVEYQKIKIAHELQMMEKEKVIHQLQRSAEEMNRKAHQSSMQLQGEVQELLLEQWLEKNFPRDSIQEVPKGVRGADCVQVVKNQRGETCGQIVYESKRTKSFSMEWIEKLKQDMQSIHAFVGVIVTQVLPEHLKAHRYQDGIWVCQMVDLPILIPPIRQMLVRLHAAKSSEQDKSDKMKQLYDYLTGDIFRTRMKGIGDTFLKMRNQITEERRSMERIWSAREKELERVYLNADRIIGDIDGIASSSNLLDYFKDSFLEEV